MKKLKLNLHSIGGKLNREQLRRINGGYNGCKFAACYGEAGVVGTCGIVPGPTSPCGCVFTNQGTRDANPGQCYN